MTINRSSENAEKLTVEEWLATRKEAGLKIDSPRWKSRDLPMAGFSFLFREISMDDLLKIPCQK